MPRLSLLFISFIYSIISVAQVILAKEIGLDDSNGDPSQLTVHSSYLFFSAEDENGRELWTVNLQGETNLVKDIYTGSKSSIQKESEFYVFNDKLFFTANNGINGNELWISDGTNEGTQLLKDIFEGGNSSFISHFTEWNNQLFFIASDNEHGVELWSSNGTTDGTKMVADIQTGKRSGAINIVGSTTEALFFVGNDGLNGNELWKTDGSLQGTMLVKDIYAGFRSASISKGIDFNNAIYFRANDGTGHELWTSDGTEAGTKVVKDLHTKTLLGAYPDWFTIFNDKLYFTADDGENGVELWVTDGTANGTITVADNRSFIFKNRPRHLTVFNGALYFSYDDGINGSEIWKTDGTEQGTVLVTDIDGAYNSNPTALYVFGQQLYFSAKNGQVGTELWATEGTAISTSLVADINEGNASAYPADLTMFNGELYLTATTLENGKELFKLGTATTTDIPEKLLSKIKIYPNPASDYIKIENSSALDIKSLTIINASGQTIQSQKFGTIIDIKSLPTGNFSLQIKDNEGRFGWLNFIKQ